jgi:hypothetical protein
MKWCLVFLIMLCLCCPLAAQDTAGPDIVVRQSVEPADGAVIGQHVTLYIDVLFRGHMPYPPRVRLPDVAGLQVFRFETQATTIEDDVGGESYTGQRFEFALYPRRGGSFAIPPAAVTLLGSQGDPTGDAQGQQAALNVTVPEGADASQPVIATQHLTLDQQWAPDPKSPLKAGDALVRTITRSAEDVPGLAMLELDLSPSDGVRVYTDPPDIDDHAERGVITGRRVDRVTYVFERGGHFTLPAVSQPWWDLAEGTMKQAQAQAVTLDIAAATVSGSTTAGAAEAAWPRWVWAVAVALVVPALLGAFSIIRHRRARRIEPEVEKYRELRKVCSTADAGAVYRSFSAWRLLLVPDRQTAALAAVAPLDAVLFNGSGANWTAKDSALLLNRCATVRRSFQAVAVTPALPPLNPPCLKLSTPSVLSR